MKDPIELQIRDAEASGYSHYMAQMLKISDAQREENRKLAEIRKKRHGIDPHAQQPSTRSILAMSKEEHDKWLERPIPTKAQCQVMDDKGNVDVGERKVTLEEVSHIEAIRRRPKNSVGQSEKTSAGKERREAAMNAFIHSPPAALSVEDELRMVKMLPYTEDPVIARETQKPNSEEDTFWTHGRFLFFKNWVKGLFK